MPFSREEIAALYGEETSAAESLEEAVERVGALRRMSAVERTRLWRAQNPRKYRALRQRCAKNWRKRYPEKYRAAKARYRDRHREQVKKTNLKAQRKRRGLRKPHA